jgi:hypothetical protein
VIPPAVTAVCQIALYCLLPGISGGWRVAGGLFEIMQQHPGLPGFGGVAKLTIAYKNSVQLLTGFVITE